MVGMLPISPPNAGRAHRVAAASVAAAITLLAIAMLPFSRSELPAYPAFMPAYGALVVLTDALTAVLLMVQAQISRRRSCLRLSQAYLLSAMTIVPHLLAFPGAVSAGPLIGGADTAIWLWCAWHGGFAIAIIRFALAGEAGPAGGVLRAVVLVAFAAATLTMVATLGLPWLPPLLKTSSFTRLNSMGVGPAVLGVTVSACVLVVARLHLRDVVSTWLAVALLAASLDVALTLFGGGRFTAGWYAGRMLSLATGVTVLFSLLSELMREAGRVTEVNAQLEHLLRTDALTGLANRRAFEIALASEWRRAIREQTALSLLMIDIDVFKGFNDHYGHPAGDACLRTVTAALAGQVQRPADMAARLGGEEFAILLPLTEEAGAWQVAERVRACVAGLRLAHEASELGYVTISVGVATTRPFGDSIGASDLVDAADRALYQAKAAGRNTTHASGEAPRALLAA